jgi:hypothetical protein
MAAENVIPFIPHVTPEYQARLALAQLEALRIARDATVNIIDKIDRASAGLLEAREDHPMSGTVDLCLAFDRAARTLRQIIVLEQEVAGLREPQRRYSPAAPADGAAPKTAAPNDSEDRAERDADYERDDLRDRDDIDDYDNREFDVVLASIHKTLDRVARDLPFEERRQVLADADELAAKVRVQWPRPEEPRPSDDNRPAPRRGKGPRAPPDTG